MPSALSTTPSAIWPLSSCSTCSSAFMNAVLCMNAVLLTCFRHTLCATIWVLRMQCGAAREVVAATSPEWQGHAPRMPMSPQTAAPSCRSAPPFWCLQMPPHARRPCAVQGGSPCVRRVRCGAAGMPRAPVRGRGGGRVIAGAACEHPCFHAAAAMHNGQSAGAPVHNHLHFCARSNTNKCRRASSCLNQRSKLCL